MALGVKMGLAHKLATFGAAPVPGDAPRAMMRLSLLDWAACAIAGRDEPVARITRDLALEDGGTAEATVVGSAIRLPARAAALVNGTTSHALDYDDTHFAHIGHPSVAVIPAALAAAQGSGASGAAFLDAALVGVEASIRVGVWLGRAHYQTGFHQTATAGTFGATLAAARLLGCDAGQMAQALGLVSTRASGLKSQFGTMGKPYNAGIAAANGVETALLAARGFQSAPTALDGPQGFGPTHAGEGDENAFDGLGDDWLFEAISHKFHACCHGTHAMLEALSELPEIVPDQIESLTITTHPRWLSVCNISAPATGLEAKFSYRMTAAMALLGHDTGAIGSFTNVLCTDPAVVAMRDKVRVVADDSVAETAAQVALTLADGSVQTASHDLGAAMTLDARAAKLQHKAGALLGDATAQRLWDATSPVQGPDLAALAALLQAS